MVVYHLNQNHYHNHYLILKDYNNNKNNIKNNVDHQQSQHQQKTIEEHDGVVTQHHHHNQKCPNNDCFYCSKPLKLLETPPTTSSIPKLLSTPNNFDDLYFDDWKQKKIDPDNRRYPFCLVWTPIPLISWLFPPIGHLAIARSDGIVRDFAWPYRVGRDSKKYGRRLRILQLNPNLAQNGVQGWDDGIDKAAAYFCKQPHLILWNNCMSFVVTALNNMQYNGRTDYKEVEISWFFYNHSVYLDRRAFIKTWLPFVFIHTWILMLVIYAYLFFIAGI